MAGFDEEHDLVIAGANGGVGTDVLDRALQDGGAPNAGPCAAGVLAACVMDRTYPGAGGSIGPSFVGDLVAARHVPGLS